MEEFEKLLAMKIEERSMLNMDILNLQSALSLFKIEQTKNYKAEPLNDKDDDLPF